MRKATILTTAAAILRKHVKINISTIYVNELLVWIEKYAFGMYTYLLRYTWMLIIPSKVRYYVLWRCPEKVIVMLKI